MTQEHETADFKPFQQTMQKLQNKNSQKGKIQEEDEFDVLNYHIQVRNEIGHDKGHRNTAIGNDIEKDQYLPRAFHS